MDNVQELNQSNIANFLDGIDCFVFDCDGVLWKGSELIEGADKTLDYFRSLGKKIIFVSNNSTNSREEYKKKFDKLKLKASKEEIYASAYAAAHYLQSINFKKKAYVIGHSGIVSELKEVGIEAVTQDSENRVPEWEELENLEVDKDIGAVVVGFDRGLNYYKLSYAYICVHENNALFIATNADSTFPGAKRVFPGGGTMVKSLSYATGKQPVIVGKPEQYMLNLIAEEHKLDRNRTCMVGDRLDTDIMFGQQGGLKTLLVYTGVTKKEQVSSSDNSIYPTYAIQSLGDVHSLKADKKQ